MFQVLSCLFTKLPISNIISGMVERIPSGRITDKQVIREAFAPLGWSWRLGPVKEIREQASALAAYRAAVTIDRMLSPGWRRKGSLWDVFLKRLERRSGF